MAYKWALHLSTTWKTTRKSEVMSLPQTNRHTLAVPLALPFAALWTACYLIFPSWLVPGNPWRSLIVLCTLTLFVGANVVLVARWRLGEFRIPALHRLSLTSYSYRDWILLAALATLLLLQTYFAVGLGPIRGGDEHSFHVTGPHLLSPLWSLASRLGVAVWQVRIALLLSLTLIVVLLAGISWRARPLLTRVKDAVPRHVRIVLGLVFIIALLAVYWLAAVHLFRTPDGIVDPPITFHREPPISRYVLAALTLLFGANEPYPRLLQVVPYLLAVVYLYRMIRLTANSRAAVLGSVLFALLPPVFGYAHKSYLDSGLLFFVIAASFYLVRHQLAGRVPDLWIGTWLACTGSLYKRHAAVVFAIYFVWLGLLSLQERRWAARASLRQCGQVAWLGLATVVPWTVIVGVLAGPGRFIRPSYTLNFSNLLSPELATAYLRAFPQHVGWPTAFVAAVSAIYALALIRRPLVNYTFVWFAGYYLFFSLDPMMSVLGHDRFAMVYFPPIAVWLALLFVGEKRTRIIYKFAGMLLAFLLAVYLLFQSSVASWTAVKDGYVPWGAVHVFMQQLPEDQRGRIVTFNAEIFKFYNYKHEFTLDMRDWPLRYQADRTEDPDDVLRLCTRQGADYLLLWTGPKDVFIQYVPVELMQLLQTSPPAPLKHVKQFTNGRYGMLLLRCPPSTANEPFADP